MNPAATEDGDGRPIVSQHLDAAADPKAIAVEELTYDTYLKVQELTSLQHPLSNPEHHDEMLFIVIHQAYELWFKLVLHEMEHSIGYLREGKTLRARHFINRCVQIFKLLVQQIHILETMNPIEFLGFRDHLMPASGFQSLQYRAIEFMAGLKEPEFLTFFKNRPEMTAHLQSYLDGADLRLELYDHLRNAGFDLPDDCKVASLNQSEDDEAKVLAALKEIYSDPESKMQLYLLLESCIEFDQYLAHWRDHHVRVVERVIGSKTGTGGSSGVSYLRKVRARRVFPYLWHVRTILHK